MSVPYKNLGNCCHQSFLGYNNFIFLLVENLVYWYLIWSRIWLFSIVPAYIKSCVSVQYRFKAYEITICQYLIKFHYFFVKCWWRRGLILLLAILLLLASAENVLIPDSEKAIVSFQHSSKIPSLLGLVWLYSNYHVCILCRICCWLCKCFIKIG